MPTVPQYPELPSNKINILADRIAAQRERAAKNAAEEMERRRQEEEREKQAEEALGK